MSSFTIIMAVTTCVCLILFSSSPKEKSTGDRLMTTNDQMSMKKLIMMGQNSKALMSMEERKQWWKAFLSDMTLPVVQRIHMQLRTRGETVDHLVESIARFCNFVDNDSDWPNHIDDYENYHEDMEALNIILSVDGKSVNSWTTDDNEVVYSCPMTAGS